MSVVDIIAFVFFVFCLGAFLYVDSRRTKLFKDAVRICHEQAETIEELFVENAKLEAELRKERGETI